MLSLPQINYLENLRDSHLDVSACGNDDIIKMIPYIKKNSYIQTLFFSSYVSPELQNIVRTEIKKRNEYHKNTNPSLMNCFFNLGNSRLAAIENSRESIIEHASNRIDLFFYLMVHYYNTGYIVQLNDTNRALQHVHGNKNYRTHACHSSLFSNPFARAPNSWQHPDGVLEIWDPKNHFLNVLNTTHELPEEVNHFDTILEGKIHTSQSFWRQQALEVLNGVSMGNMEPVNAIGNFLSIMYNFFNSEKIVSRYNQVNSSPENKAIYKYQYKGTFKNKWDFANGYVFIDYLASLLQVPQAEANNLYDQGFRFNQYKTLKFEILSGRIDAPPSVQPPGFYHR